MERLVVLERFLGLAEEQREPQETVLEAAERLLTLRAVESAAGIQSVAARRLKITPRCMNYRLAKLERRPKDR